MFSDSGRNVGLSSRGKDRSGNRRFGKCAHGVGSGQWPAVRVLLDVNQDAARGAFSDNPFVGYKIRMFAGDGARDDFAESAQLLVGVDGFDRNINVNSGGAGSFQKAGNFELLPAFREEPSNGYAD